MPTTLEYMQFATHVYAASKNNEIKVPEGWTADRTPDQASGFSAAVYTNTETREVVIAYAGTNQLADVRAWSGMDGSYNAQIFQTIAYYLEFMANNPQYREYNVTFTGHSKMVGGEMGGWVGLFTENCDQSGSIESANELRLAA